MKKYSNAVPSSTETSGEGPITEALTNLTQGEEQAAAKPQVSIFDPDIPDNYDAISETCVDFIKGLTDEVARKILTGIYIYSDLGDEIYELTNLEDFSKDELISLIKMAHSKEMTFNQLIVYVIEKALNEFETIERIRAERAASDSEE